LPGHQALHPPQVARLPRRQQLLSAGHDMALELRRRLHGIGKLTQALNNLAVGFVVGFVLILSHRA
jgi:hypothetical protein